MSVSTFLALVLVSPGAPRGQTVTSSGSRLANGSRCLDSSQTTPTAIHDCQSASKSRELLGKAFRCHPQQDCCHSAEWRPHDQPEGHATRAGSCSLSFGFIRLGSISTGPASEAYDPHYLVLP
jgi:hypothetical protein